MSIKLTTLPSGLRIITDTVDSVDSVALGVWADVGTRHEDMAENGVAHMVEHMMFKGTPSRTTAQIAEQIEDVGGQVNAYTSRELTAYHIHLLKEDMGLALDILSDIMQHPAMPEDEIERERDVILQEIGMNADTPDDLVFDHYQETAYPGQALGAPILGSADIVGSMKRETMMKYVSRFYTPGRLVVSAAGNVDHEEFSARVASLFTDLPADLPGHHDVAAYKGGEKRENKDLEQSHIVMGWRGIPRKDKDIHAASALGTLLGGGMSSRLFQEVREKRGLVYAVFAFHSAFQDDGQFSVYAGTGPERLPELVPVICDEIMKLADTVTDEELKRTKAQMRAGIVMGRESMMGRANQQAKVLIHTGKIPDVKERLRKIEDLQTADIARVARRIFATPLTLAALGPLKTLESYDRMAGRLRA